MKTPAVLRDDSPEAAALLRAGWTVAARSFGARLDGDRVDRDRLRALASGRVADVTTRELGPHDVDDVLALDAQTLDGYPGSVATRHEPFDRSSATPGPTRRAWGALTSTGRLVGLTVVDLDGPTAETDVTVVHPDHRGRGLAAAVKAASVLALLDAGVLRFRTGGPSTTSRSSPRTPPSATSSTRAGSPWSHPPPERRSSGPESSLVGRRRTMGDHSTRPRE